MPKPCTLSLEPSETLASLPCPTDKSGSKNDHPAPACFRSSIGRPRPLTKGSRNHLLKKSRAFQWIGLRTDCPPDSGGHDSILGNHSLQRNAPCKTPNLF